KEEKQTYTPISGDIEKYSNLGWVTHEVLGGSLKLERRVMMENIVDFLAFRMVRKVISGLVFMLLLFLKPTPITHWIFLVVLCWFGGEVVHFIVSPKQRFAFRWGMLDLDTDMFPHDYLEAVALKEWAAKRLNDDALAFVKTYTSLNLVEAEHEKFLKRTPLSQKEMEEFRKNRRHLEEEISRLEGKRSAA